MAANDHYMQMAKTINIGRYVVDIGITRKTHQVQKKIKSIDVSLNAERPICANCGAGQLTQAAKDGHLIQCIITLHINNITQVTV